MATHFMSKTVNFPSGTGRRSTQAVVEFPATVRRADVALNGFKLDFGGTGAVQRPIGVIEVDVDFVRVSGRTVIFDVQAQYADANFDDPYTGYVTVLVIADLV